MKTVWSWLTVPWVSFSSKHWRRGSGPGERGHRMSSSSGSGVLCGEGKETAFAGIVLGTARVAWYVLCLQIFVRTQELNIRCIFFLGMKELSPRLWLCNKVVGARSQTSPGSIWLRTHDHHSYPKILQKWRNYSTFLVSTWKNRLAPPPEVSSALIMKVWETPNHYKLHTVLWLGWEDTKERRTQMICWPMSTF